METQVVFLDLSKAFNRVYWKGLIHKLQCNGVALNLLMLFKIFFITVSKELS